MMNGMPWYSLLLYLHIFSVVLSIGPYFVLFPLLVKIKKAPFDEIAVYLEPFRITVRLTKHAGHVLVATGIALIWLGPWSWSTPWVLTTVVIMVASLFFIARAFSPLMRKLSAPHDNREQLTVKLQRALILYILITMTMMWFMVAKPVMWG
jgi:hypothetical protein